MRNLLLVLAAVGWLLSVVGAVLDRVSAMKLTAPGDGTWTLADRPRLGTGATLLIVGGATVGAVGTILAVFQTA